MNQVHLHLLITHLPIFGSILGALVLTYGLISKSLQTQIAAFALFVISSVGAGIAYFTGEAAEETVENIQGVAEGMIEQHEESALLALVSLIILGSISIIALVLKLKKPNSTDTLGLAVLIISLVCFGLVARTGYLGGQIRHTEIHSNPTYEQEHSSKADINKNDFLVFIE